MIDLKLHPELIAFSTSRGVAHPSGPYDGFNACHYVGDDPAHVRHCRSKLCCRLGVEAQQLIIPRQTHSDRVAIIDRIPYPEENLQGVDALVTALPSVALAINTADCVPVLLAHPASGIIAAAHCGWRGIINNLLPNTLRAMASLGAKADEIIAVMGPAICHACFEVGTEVAQIFAEHFPDTSNIIIEGYEKPHIDLSAAIVEKLRRLGVPSVNVRPSSECTMCNPAEFFSARVLGVKSGRLLTLIAHRH